MLQSREKNRTAVLCQWQTGLCIIVPRHKDPCLLLSGSLRVWNLNDGKDGSINRFASWHGA